ncbi:guanine nucleotide binding protein alpha subunit [Naegleria gruberi]|uniref:Guanine nucleotide binding protein alpha subunit n=1 Tax=Naegleria gruberi TaxID=5762 RepID=D2V1X4_NAEGR|nr:guanine nucleotide binding protein alpha subunit [Naegleria gruberi]EFC49387.1 guanine nucleotide binding protein alpha subunit [Naegleria gruberi]|eukprot:XP_002682131.1 guanine nucleotide binding protein alpha subunit [Naegleria gruberi strain NEG-M]
MESLLSFFFPSITSVIRESNEHERMKKEMMNRYLKKKKAFGDVPPGQQQQHKLEPNMMIPMANQATATVTTQENNGHESDSETTATQQLYKKLKSTIGQNQIIPLSTVPFDKPIPLYMSGDEVVNSNETTTASSSLTSPSPSVTSNLSTTTTTPMMMSNLSTTTPTTTPSTLSTAVNHHQQSSSSTTTTIDIHDVSPANTNNQLYHLSNHISKNMNVTTNGHFSSNAPSHRKEMNKATSSNAQHVAKTKKVQKSKYESPSVYTLMLSGTLGSGKTTLFRQFRLVFQEGFNRSEIERMRMYIITNLLQSFSLGVSLYLNEVDAIKNGTTKVTRENRFMLDETLYEKFKEFDSRVTSLQSRYTLFDISKLPQKEFVVSMWEDTDVRKVLNRYALTDSMTDGMDYYLRDHGDTSAVKRMFKKLSEYEPSVEDIIGCRCKTTGITCLDYDYLGMPFRVYDVGGARTERKKYNNIYAGLTGVLYTTSLIDFRKTCYEDDFSNRMIESINLFEEQCNGPLKYSPIFLIFTKIDILSETISDDKSLFDLFPDFNQYPVPDQNNFFTNTSSQLNPNNNPQRYLLDKEVQISQKVLKTLSFIESKFKAKDNHNPKRIFTFYMNALDTIQFKQLMEIITSTIYPMFAHNQTKPNLSWKFKTHILGNE